MSVRITPVAAKDLPGIRRWAEAVVQFESPESALYTEAHDTLRLLATIDLLLPKEARNGG